LHIGSVGAGKLAAGGGLMAFVCAIDADLLPAE